jgi:endoglucanase
MTPPRFSAVLGLGSLLLVACGSNGTPQSPARRGASPEGFIRRAGASLVDEKGNQVILRGVAFGNNVWGNPSTPNPNHHDERDFARVASFGMNAVRFYLNYGLFEDDGAPYEYKQSGWDWVDRNVAWARAHGVRLILNLHVPQGGFQSNGGGDALWTSKENQDRFVALWRAIAERYANELVIAGYDLLNEPRPTTSRSAWSELATRATRAVREVDDRHLIFVERTNSVGDDWSRDSELDFFLLPDENAVYEFHFYEPFEYTHQFASWLNRGEGGKYPDESRISSAGLNWYLWSYEPKPPPYLEKGDSDWKLYESQPYVIRDPKIKAIGVTLMSELNAGTAWFDDVTVKEYDETGKLLGTIYEMDLESLDDWYFWRAGNTGTAAVSTEAHSGSASLSITGTDHDASLSGSWRFAVKPGHAYSVSVWMKGKGVGDESRPDPRGSFTQVTRALARLDYYSAEGEVFARNKASLKASLDAYAAWGKKHDVPLFLGEFGLMRQCFENDRGGTAWVSDVLDILSEHGTSFTYHAYHEVNFGIFSSESSTTLPDERAMNQALVSLFRSRFLAQ